MIQIVAVDHNTGALESLDCIVSGTEVKVHCCSDAFEAWELIRSVRPEIAVLEHSMPGITGMEMLAKIVEWDPSVDVVLTAEEGSTDLAVDAILKGATGYLTKPFSPAAVRERLEPLIENAIRRRRTRTTEEELLTGDGFNGMIGRSRAMLDVYEMIRRIAPHFRSALVTGATGCGKELVARSLHQMSPLRGKPFVVCNCAAIVESLFESELFGHVRGSFTGATGDRAGLFEAADGGTLFLDEVGEVPLHMQAKFLRVLQNGEVQRVGSNVVRRVNVRVVAATNRDLRAMVAKGEFREDLFYRLSMLEVKLPALAERKDDLPLLVRHFVQQFAELYGKEVRGLTRRAHTLLSRYGWPGNIRELENVIGHACAMTEDEVVDVADLPAYLRSAEGRDEGRAHMTLAEVELKHVKYVHELAGGNKQMTADILGISRATLYRFLSDKPATVPGVAGKAVAAAA